MKRKFSLILLLTITLTLGACSTQPSTTGIQTYTAHATVDQAIQQQQAIDQYRHAGNLWDVLRDDFKLDQDESRPVVQKQVQYFLQHKEVLTTLAQRAKPYLYYIYQQVKKRNLPAELVLLPMIESSYNPFMYSAVGAGGLWQIMPGTASGLNIKQNWWFDGRRDIVQSTNAALNYLADLQQYFKGSWLLAIAAYDTGAGTVDNAIKQSEKDGKGRNFWVLQLSEETETYIPKLLALAAIIAHPEKYHVSLPPIKDAPYLAQVDTQSQIDLHLAAKMAHLTLTQLIQLNPGFNRWASPPNGPFTILVPVEIAPTFEANLRMYPQSKRITWQHINVEPGDTLSKLAKQFHTSIGLIKKINSLRSNHLGIREPLIIAQDKTTLPKNIISTVHQYMAIKNNLPGPKMSIHDVTSGESLWSIAKEYGAKIQSLRFWNHLTPSDKIQPNDKLIIWSKSQRGSANIATKNIYIVRRGDSLSTIAQQYNVSVDDIKTDNHLRSDTIRLGQKLIITTTSTPAPSQYQVKLAGQHLLKTVRYSVKSGDYLNKIAAKFNVTVDQILDWNNINAQKILHPGENLLIKTYI